MTEDQGNRIIELLEQLLLVTHACARKIDGIASGMSQGPIDVNVVGPVETWTDPR